MLQPYSIVAVADNTGAQELRLIQAASGKRSQITLGDSFTATVKKARPVGQIKKGQVVKAIVVRQRKPFKRPDGTTIRFADNAAVVIGADRNPIGSRVIGPIAKEIRDKGFNKIAQLAKELV